MKGDFGRITFDATRHMRRVLSQQGRVELEADANEQTAIILHYLEAMMTDLIGPYAAPIPPAGSPFDNFRIVTGDDATFNFGIDPGHYWVDGVLCENDAIEPVLFTEQPDVPQDDPPAAGSYLAYLDVWERHLSADEDPRSREVALGGPDTASRARLVWQVKLDLLDNVPKPATLHDEWPEWIARWQPPNRGLLTAEARTPTDATDPCVTPPDSRYRGLENQLYRVEVHSPGTAAAATFKWSRDNGSIVYPIRWLRGATVRVDRLSQDPRFTLKPGDWVEVVDDRVARLGTPGVLGQVDEVDYDELEVTLDAAPGASYEPGDGAHPLLRRWDTRGESGDTAIAEGAEIDLEDGIVITFHAAAAGPAGGAEHEYRTGDYWVFPARVATGDVEWPQLAAGGPAPRGPDGVLHHYAPLALIGFSADGTLSSNVDLRRRILEGTDAV
jgi:Family of unknown function (DUF6519)